MMHLCFAGGLRVSELVGTLTERSRAATPSLTIKARGVKNGASRSGKNHGICGRG